MTTEHTKLFTGSNIIVNGVKNLLDTEDISYIIKDRFESARLGGFGEQMDTVEVHVLDTDVEKAKTIINAYKAKINE
ncbi:putative signal transducing protein [Polaribacter glomeratus]|uniref:DUF2007 domain-containing protein n=1 Tax=Polaribacter glomeratus TaxID=102 RepID=A0A2S7WIT7_9FLAO|nr:DUF2007 domain-containing protein [Polaribacter glomeratus]PQJ77510.1 hypothetical protein BTO16_16965 [Polaribacter glomeratus]TXD66103.1 DUF2007 domain-containing protein [Polaribacter glomeratus]